MKSLLMVSFLIFTISKASAQSLSYTAAATSFAVGTTLLVASPYAENLDQKVIFNDCMTYYATGVISDDLTNLIEKVGDDPKFLNLSEEELIALILDQLSMR